MSSKPFAVCVFAASSERVAPVYRKLAQELGQAVATAGWELVYGGGQAGLMGEIAKGALAGGGKVTGIIPQALNSAERAFDEVTELVVVDSLSQRKQQMDSRSDAFLVLPGGIGTLDELTDVLAALHLGMHSRPLVMVDPDGFWQPFGELLRHMVVAELMPEESTRMVTVAHSVQAALDAIASTASM